MAASKYVTSFLSEELLQTCFDDSLEDIRFGSEEANFIKGAAVIFTEFNTKLQKLIAKQDATRIKTFPEGSLYTSTWAVLNSMKKTSHFMGEFGKSLDDVVVSLNSTVKIRTSERKKVYGESSASLTLLKSSRGELDKKMKEYQAKSKIADDAIASVAKAKSSAKSKPKDIVKAEAKEEKALNSLSVATEVYEYQLKLTNDLVFETYNSSFPDQLKKFEDFKTLGIKHYTMIARQITKLYESLPKHMKRIHQELEKACQDLSQEETVNTFIKNKGSTTCSLPTPVLFEVYQGNSDSFPIYTPKEQEPFVYEESLTSLPTNCEVDEPSSSSSSSSKSKSKPKKKGRKHKKNESVDDGSGVPVEEEIEIEETKPITQVLQKGCVMPSILTDSTTYPMPSDIDVDSDDGVPLEDSDDGVPLEDSDDGVPLEDSDDGVPLEDSDDGVPLEDSDDGVPLEDSDDGVPMEEPASVSARSIGGISLDKSGGSPAASSIPASSSQGISLAKKKPKKSGNKPQTISMGSRQKAGAQIPQAGGSMGAAEMFMAQQMMMMTNPQYRETMAAQFAQNPALYQQYQMQMAQYQQAVQQQFVQQAGQQPVLSTPGSPSLQQGGGTLRAPGSGQRKKGSRRARSTRPQSTRPKKASNPSIVDTQDVNSVVAQLGMTTLSMTDEQKDALRSQFGDGLDDITF